MTKKIFIMILILTMTMTTACGKTKTPIDGSEDQNSSDAVETPGKLDEDKAEVEELDPKEMIDLSLEPNEAGKIMVLMYHNIGEEEKEWVRTADNLRKDLSTLYEKGYRTISLSDYVSGNINTPEGFTPIVLTFDDGNKNNFEYLEDGTIDEDSAVGILMDFSRQHPDFGSRATFFLNGDLPFGQKGREGDKFKFLLENGMDIGNHTRTHANFTKISKEALQEEIGGQAQFLKDFIEDDQYKIETIALPFGSRPKDDSLTSFLREGSYNGVGYKNIAILNVGWNPGFSPYDSRFDFESIPRIRASEMKVDNVGMYNYIEYFDNHPDERFISDGFAEVVTVPENKSDLIEVDSDREVYIYKGKVEEVSN